MKDYCMGIMEKLDDSLASLTGHLSYTNYLFSVDKLDGLSGIFVVSIKGQAWSNALWQYQMDLTCKDKQISIASFHIQAIFLTLPLNQFPLVVTKISSFGHVVKISNLYGLITEFIIVVESEDQAHCRVKREVRRFNDSFSLC